MTTHEQASIPRSWLVTLTLLLALLPAGLAANPGHGASAISAGTFEAGDFTVNGNLNVTSTNDICIDGGNCLSSVGGVTGSGTANTLPLWTGSSSLGDSIITQSGGDVLVSGTIESYDLEFRSSNQSTHIGPNSGASGTSGTTYVGYNAGNDDLTYVTAVGSNAGSFSTGSDSTYVGKQAGYLATANSITAVGLGAGGSANGTRTIGIGVDAGLSSNSDNLIAIGYRTGYNNEQPNNIFIGESSGSGSSVDNTIGIGKETLNSADGSYGIFIGEQAGYSDSGSYTYGIGYEAGWANNGARSLMYGYQAGFDNSGNDNIFLGYQAGYQNTQNNQFIVKQANVNTQPLIHGEFDTAQLGIATNNPQASLDVNGSARIQGNLNVTSGNDVCIDGGECLSTAGGGVSGTGSVNAIPIWTGSDTLGNSKISQSGNTVAIDANLSMPDSFAIGQGASVVIDTGYSSYAIGTNAQASADGVAIGEGASADGGVGIGYLSGADALGGVAIGWQASSPYQSIALGSATTTAAGQLVAGGGTIPITDVYVGDGVISSSPEDTVYHATGGSGSNIIGGNLVLAGGKSTGNAAPGSILFKTSDPGGSGSSLQPLSTKGGFNGSDFYIDQDTFYVDSSTDSVGIGTTTPQEALELGLNNRMKLTSNKTNLNESSVIRLHAADNQSKPAVGWFDHNDQRIAAIVGHNYLDYPSNQHKHWSIETQDSKGALQTRMEFPYGEDNVTIETSNANFKVGAGYNLTLGTSAGLNTIMSIYGDAYFYETNDFGVGDKDWAAQGLETGAKWEFYRNTSTSTLMVHQDDGSSDAELHLRSGTKDYQLANDANKFHIKEEGTPALTIDGTGQAGIGTTTPQATLDVNGTIALQTGTPISEFSTDGTLTDNSDDAAPTEQAVKSYVDTQLAGSGNVSGSGTANEVAYWDSSSTITGESDLYWDTTRNQLGIGTTPSRALHVVGGGIITQGLTVDGNGLIVETSPNQVAINRDYASETLHVNGTIRADSPGAFTSTYSGSFYQPSLDTSTSVLSARNVLYINLDSDNNTAGTAELRVTRDDQGKNGVTVFEVSEDGEVGINTDAPSAALEVVGETKLYSDLGEDLRLGRDDNQHLSFNVDDKDAYIDYEQDADGAGADDHILYIRNNAPQDGGEKAIRLVTNSTNRMTINNDGNVGIGTDAPSYLLEVAGSAAKPGGGSWTDSSDERLKTNITALSGQDALSKITGLSTVSYQWKNPQLHGNQTGVRVGITAQELEKTFPQWVSEVQARGADAQEVNGTAKAITYPHDFNAYIIESVKQLDTQDANTQEQLAQIASRVEALEEENAQLRARVNQLENQH